MTCSWKKGLESALGKRGFSVTHNGTASTHAPAGLPDIVIYNPKILLTVEATKSKGAAQDRELNAIRDHLNDTKEQHADKQCFCVFTSPATSPRMFDGIRDHNKQRVNEGKPDIKILPVCFETLEIWLKHLIESEAELYPMDNFLRLFEYYPDFIDDLRIRKLLIQNVFPMDNELASVIEKEETERDQQTLESLIRDLARMENYMRENGIAVGHFAIDTLIYLVFMKLYEEKRERNGAINRLRSKEVFELYRRDSVDIQTRNAGRAIHKLFYDIKREGEFLSSQMFTEGDNLADSVNDNFILNYVIPNLGKYQFLGTRIDALGAVYEVLALRAEKDVKVGQFFTPENIVRFMVQLADLDYSDRVLDPACGTGRFLIYSMNDMLGKLERSDVRDRDMERIQVRLHQLFGADVDPRIAKIAKMNMWVHGDGKANIFGGPAFNGLTLYKHGFDGIKSFDNAFDVVLTNPPLGNLNYQNIEFIDRNIDPIQRASETLRRMPILPHRNVLEEQLKKVCERLEEYRKDLEQLRVVLAEAQDTSAIREWLRVNDAQTPEQRERKRVLRQTDEVKAYSKLCSRINGKNKTIERNEGQRSELESRLRTGQQVWEITGNTMKGGALFLTAIWHYLKNNAYPGNLPEWRGGKLLIILDEGILNTGNYSRARDFIRTHYYIKAIISLTRDTFIPISRTSTKTSILYAVKKTDLDAIQKEPIFLGHVEKVGLDTKGKVCSNDLESLIQKYREFQQKVKDSYVGLEFNRGLFSSQGFEAGSI